VFIEYAWLIPLLPLLAFVVVGFFGKKLPEGGGYIAIGSAIAAFALAALVSYEYLTGDMFAASEPYVVDMQWLTFGRYELNFGIYIDSLTCVMMLFSSFISTLIFVYSIGYMHGEGKNKRRYYAEIASFLHDALGQIFVLMTISVAAAEVGVGIAILLHAYKTKKTTDVDDLTVLRW
jgi:NADH-quinone oxidoreductase subunit L